MMSEILLLFVIFALVYALRARSAGDKAGPADAAANQAANAAASLLDADAVRILELPAEMKQPPAAVLRRRWGLPPDVSRELAAFIDLTVRDFVLNWFRSKADGSGVSPDEQFVEATSFALANVVGNLCFRASHLNPLAVLYDDVFEAVRVHLYWYGEMKAAAAEKQPDLFVPLSDEQLLKRARASGGAGGNNRAAGGGAGAGAGAAAEAQLQPLPVPVVLTSASSATMAAVPATPSVGAMPPPGATAVTGSAVLSTSDARLIAQERLRIEEVRERAILAQYRSAHVLHPAVDVQHTAILEAAPSATSCCNAPEHTSAGPPQDMLTQFSYLRPVCAQLVAKLLPPAERSSALVTVLMRELLTTCLLVPGLSNAEPDTLNSVLLYYLNMAVQTPMDTSFWAPTEAELQQQAAEKAAAEKAATAEKRPPRVSAATAAAAAALAASTAAATSTRTGSMSEGLMGLNATRSARASFSVGTPSATATPAVTGAAAAGPTLPVLRATITTASDSNRPLYTYNYDFDAPMRSGSATSVAEGPVLDAGWRYFHGDMSRSDAEKLLAGLPPASFLLRSKETGTMVLSYVRPPAVAQLTTASGSAATTAAAEASAASAPAAPSAASATSGATLGQSVAPSVGHMKINWTDQSQFTVLNKGPYPSLSACLRALKHIASYGCVLDTQAPAREAALPNITVEALYAPAGSDAGKQAPPTLSLPPSAVSETAAATGGASAHTSGGGSIATSAVALKAASKWQEKVADRKAAAAAAPATAGPGAAVGMPEKKRTSSFRLQDLFSSSKKAKKAEAAPSVALPVTPVLLSAATPTPTPTPAAVVPAAAAPSAVGAARKLSDVAALSLAAAANSSRHGALVPAEPHTPALLATDAPAALADRISRASIVTGTSIDDDELLNAPDEDDDEGEDGEAGGEEEGEEADTQGNSEAEEDEVEVGAVGEAGAFADSDSDSGSGDDAEGDGSAEDNHSSSASAAGGLKRNWSAAQILTRGSSSGDGSQPDVRSSSPTAPPLIQLQPQPLDRAGAALEERIRQLDGSAAVASAAAAVKAAADKKEAAAALGEKGRSASLVLSKAASSASAAAHDGDTTPAPTRRVTIATAFDDDAAAGTQPKLPASPPSSARRPAFEGLRPSSFPSLAAIAPKTKVGGAGAVPGTAALIGMFGLRREASKAGTPVLSAAAAVDPDAPVVLQPTSSLADTLALASAATGPKPLPSPDAHPLEAKVVRAAIRVDAAPAFDPKAVVRYVIACTFGPARWHVKARYSEFHELHELIKATVPSFTGVFPPKRPFLLADHYDADFIEKRRKALDDWLAAVLACAAARDTQEVRTFLSPRHPAHVIIDSQPVRSSLRTAAFAALASSRAFGAGGLAKSGGSGQAGASPSGDGDSPTAPLPLSHGSSEGSTGGAAAALAATGSLTISSASSASGDGSGGVRAAGKRATFAEDVQRSRGQEARGSDESGEGQAEDGSGRRNRSNDRNAQSRTQADGAADGSTTAVQLRDGGSKSGLRQRSKRESGRSAAGGAGGGAGNRPDGSSSRRPRSSDYQQQGQREGESAVLRILSPTELQHAEMRLFQLMTEVFGLASGGWLRRQMVGFVRSLLKLLYHGSAARRVADAYQHSISPAQLAFRIRHVTMNVLWPGGVFRVSVPPRSWALQAACREQCREALLAAIPAALASLLGRDAAAEGMVKLYEFIQIPALVQSFAYTLLDLLLRRLFPGIAVHGLPALPPADTVRISSRVRVRTLPPSAPQFLSVADMREGLGVSLGAGLAGLASLRHVVPEITTAALSTLSRPLQQLPIPGLPLGQLTVDMGAGLSRAFSGTLTSIRAAGGGRRQEDMN